MKVAVISGGSGAIGTAIVKRFEAEGYTVVSLSRAQGDFAKPEEIKKTLGELHARHKKIDVGVHAAWPKIMRKKLLDTTEEEFKLQMEVGVMGGFVFLRELGRLMQIQQSGVLIGITTALLDTAQTKGAVGAYVPAKYALYGTLQILRDELKASGVDVHAIAPDFMPVGLNKDLPKRLFEMLEEKQGAFPTPEEVAEKVFSVASGHEKDFSIPVT